MPVASNDWCMGLSEQITVEFPQLQCSDKMNDVPVVQVVAWVPCWTRVPTVQTVQKTGEIPQVLFLDTVETPVVVQ